MLQSKASLVIAVVLMPRIASEEGFIPRIDLSPQHLFDQLYLFHPLTPECCLRHLPKVAF